MKKFAALMSVLVFVLLAGCNTVHGFGQDMQKVGDAISGASKK